MLKIALTGNIAAGKSVVEKMLKDLHYQVIDTDEISHNLLANSDDLIEQIKISFEGYDIYSNNLIDRRKLAKIVFNDDKMLKKLESIIHPYIIDEIMKFFERNENESFTFVSVPLLYEVNWLYMFDKVILVAASDAVRLQRLIARRNMTEEDALLRMKTQIPQDEKIGFADFVIYNNTNYIDLNRQITEILYKLI